MYPVFFRPFNPPFSVISPHMFFLKLSLIPNLLSFTVGLLTTLMYLSVLGVVGVE